MFRVFSVRQAAASPAVPSAEFLAPKGRGQHAKRPPPKKLARRHDSGFTAGVSSCLLSDLGSDMRGRKRMERRAQLVAMRQPETPRSGLRAKPANPCRPSAGVRPRAGRGAQQAHFVAFDFRWCAARPGLLPEMSTSARLPMCSSPSRHLPMAYLHLLEVSGDSHESVDLGCACDGLRGRRK